MGLEDIGSRWLELAEYRNALFKCNFPSLEEPTSTPSTSSNVRAAMQTDPKMGAVAAVLVENGPRPTIVALNRG